MSLFLLEIAGARKGRNGSQFARRSGLVLFCSPGKSVASRAECGILETPGSSRLARGLGILLLVFPPDAAGLAHLLKEKHRHRACASVSGLA